MTATRQAILNPEHLMATLEEIKARKGAPPWGEPLFLSDETQVYIICQAPGAPTDTHYHEHDEWWLVLEGATSWQFEFDPTPRVVTAPGFIWAPKNQWHHIEVVGEVPSIRVAIGVKGEYHRYDRPGCQPLPKP
jgi:mannose-6-phosphate isomerase-like protein (cupin superfamily)